MGVTRGQFKSLFYSLLTLSLIIVSTDTFGAIISVPSEHPTIQAGIDAANTGDTVLVANGTYTGPGNRDLDFKGKAITVISAGGPENCIIDVQSSSLGPGRGFYFHSGEGEDSALSGFTITRGFVYDSPFHDEDFGSGIYIDSDCAPTIANCIIKGNEAGGGIFSLGAPKISNCTIESNYGVDYAGGIHSDGPAIIKDCIIRENCAIYGSGGLIARNATTIQRCSIINNFGDHGAGGASISDSDIIDCIIDSNWTNNSPGSGAGISVWGSYANIINCTISNNRGDHASGGGIYVASGSPTIVGCNIFGNSAVPQPGGGGIGCSGSSPIIDRCNINNNYGGWTGGGIRCGGSSVIVKNSIIHGNMSTYGGGISVEPSDISSPSSVTIINCTISRNKSTDFISEVNIAFKKNILG